MTIILIILICITIISLLQIILAAIFYNLTINTRRNHSKRFQHGKNKVIIPPLNKEEEKLLEKVKHIYIKSTDNLQLHALELKKETNRDWIIMTHGCFSNAEHLMPYAMELQHKYNLLLIELRGHGKSEGNYIDFGIKSRYDILCWINYLNDLYNFPIIGLYGFSMGASSIMMTTNFDLPKNVKFIIEDSGYTSANEELKYQLGKIYHLPIFPILMLANSYIKMKHGFNIKEANVINSLKYNQVPILFIHGSSDPMVPTNMVDELYKSNLGKKEKLIVKNASHINSMFKSKDEYWKKVKEFIDTNQED